MIKWLIGLARKFLEKHGYFIMLKEKRKEQNDLYTKLMNENNDLNMKLNSYQGEIDDLKDRIKNSEILSMEQLRDENQRLQTEHDQIRVEMNKAEEYYKTVQKQVRTALHDDRSFSFAKNMCFPGSSSVSCETLRETFTKPIDFTVICGRTTMDDEATAKLKQIVGIDQKYAYCLNYLMKLGLINKIAKNLVNGGLVITIAYNEDCTVNELYYEAKCMVPETGHIIIK